MAASQRASLALLSDDGLDSGSAIASTYRRSRVCSAFKSVSEISG